MIKEQLEKSGLFTVELQSTEWVTYSKDRTADAYPVYQLGWFPDYSDADNYLTPFFVPGNFLKNHYENPAVTDLISKQLTTVDKAEREKVIGEAQTRRRQGPVHAAAAAGRPAYGRRQGRQGCRPDPGCFLQDPSWCHFQVGSHPHPVLTSQRGGAPTRRPAFGADTGQQIPRLTRLPEHTFRYQ